VIAAATPTDTPRAPDVVTLIAVSALAYVLAVGLHEHGGHATACVLLGGHAKELGAFYVDCDDAGMSSLSRRLVQLAGPLASLILGLASFGVLRRLSPTRPLAYYFTWLLGGLGLMSASGYPLFSGVSGLGDLGTTQDGALFGATPEWLWRGVLTAAGGVAYLWVVQHLCRSIAPLAGAAGSAQMTQVRRATTVSYVTGAVVYLAIGAFNPLGWSMILLSVLPSSLGGTSGLLWMWSLYRKTAGKRTASIGVGLGLGFARDATWIALSALVVLAYAALFATSWRP
jgi:hypothetical protein